MPGKRLAKFLKSMPENMLRLTGDSKSGFIARHTAKGDTMIFVDHVSATWLRVRAEADRKTSTEIINELVRKEIAAQAG